MKEITFKFDNEDAAQHFLLWLCESGEQDYWMWMEYREQEEDGQITVLSFDYHGGLSGYDNFGKHPIVATCGRMSKG